MTPYQLDRQVPFAEHRCLRCDHTAPTLTVAHPAGVVVLCGHCHRPLRRADEISVLVTA